MPEWIYWLMLIFFAVALLVWLVDFIWNVKVTMDKADVFYIFLISVALGIAGANFLLHELDWGEIGVYLLSFVMVVGIALWLIFINFFLEG